MTEPKAARGMSDVEVVARTIWAEARNGGREGMENVAQVILTRAANPRWWGSTARGVCLQRNQFSCWWVQDANYQRMLAAGSGDMQFRSAHEIASRALLGRLPADRTGGADHYYAPGGMTGGAAPRWADPAKLTLEAHGHRFYRLELPAPQDRQPETPKSYATAAGTTIVGTAVAGAQAMGDLDWRVAIALIVAVGIGFAVWRFVLARQERAA